MNAESDKVFTLLDEIYFMPRGDAQIALAEEAVRLADLTGDSELQVTTRFELIGATVHGGESEKAIVAFSWCLKKYDERPEDFDTFQLFWQYKWILGHIPNFPNVSRGQIDSIFEDAVRRYRKQNLSLRPIYGEMCSLEIGSGNAEKAAEYYRKWLLEPRDYNADCHACETDRRVQYLAFAGRDEEAVETAGPILKGEQQCAEIPHLTFGNLLLPLFRLGRLELASELFTKGYRLVSANKDFLATVSQHLRFLALDGKTEMGLSLFEKHLGWALETKELNNRFWFYAAALELFAAVEDEVVRLSLPNGFRGFDRSGLYEVTVLREAIRSEAAAIAPLFDRRNGNDYFARQLG